jgi:hypothetical protein
VPGGAAGEALVPVEADGGAGPAPVNIADDALEWSITIVLRESMRIKVDYYMASPNNRLYDLSVAGFGGTGADSGSLEPELGGAAAIGQGQAAGQAESPDGGSPFADAVDLGDGGGSPFAGAADLGGNSPFASSGGEPGGSPFAIAPESAGAAFAGAAGDAGAGSVAEEGEPPYYPYVVNTFEGAPVRLAIFARMPALRGVETLEFSGSGFGGGEPWQVEGDAGDFSLPDWTATDPSWQLFGLESSIAEGGSIGDRFIVLSLPYAREGARVRLERIVLRMEDGREIVFENTDPSDVAIQAIEAPQLH